MSDEISDMNDKLVGKSEDYLIDHLGAPTNSETLGSYTIYSYVNDRGVTTSGYASNFSSAKSTQHYQLTRFYFKDGKVKKWDYEKK